MIGRRLCCSIVNNMSPINSRKLVQRFVPVLATNWQLQQLPAWCDRTKMQCESRQKIWRATNSFEKWPNVRIKLANSDAKCLPTFIHLDSRIQHDTEALTTSCYIVHSRFQDIPSDFVNRTFEMLQSRISHICETPIISSDLCDKSEWKKNCKNLSKLFIFKVVTNISKKCFFSLCCSYW